MKGCASMSFFEKIKEAILGTQEKSVSNINKTNRGYIPTYNIEDWQPKLKYPEYDALFSLKKYLESIDLPQTIVQKVMNSKNPFGEAKNLFVKPPDNVAFSDMCWQEAIRRERWIKVLSLWMSPPERIIESTFAYILLRLGWLCHWDMYQQKALDINGLDYVLEACKHNDYEKIVKVVDNDVLSCFALAHLRSKKTLTEIVADGFLYLDNNTTHNGSAQGSFYNLYGKQQLQGLIGKIIEGAYIQNKFSLKKLFLDSEKYEEINENSLKYNFSEMRKDKDIYIPTEEMKDDIISDVLKINNFLLEANSLHKIPKFFVSSEDILFFFGKETPYEHHFCYFTYNPNTPTGKASKYPCTLWFNCSNKKATFFGRIDYLANNDIGKISITISDKNNCYNVKVAIRDNQLKVI